jgi:hypothetical protein
MCLIFCQKTLYPNLQLFPLSKCGKPIRASSEGKTLAVGKLCPILFESRLILFKRGQSLTVEAYTDIDYAG